MTTHGSNSTSKDIPMFPLGFRFGAATAAYQIDGAVNEAGKGPSIWDWFAEQPGHMKDGNGTVAIDHYHQVESDVQLLSDLGLDDYRFSICWPRVVPEGRGRINPQGLDFYDRLVDGLLEHGIRPVPTLYHWDLPLALQDNGGWLERATAEAFAEYAAVMGERLGDRISTWITTNEIGVHTLYGHALTDHAPGLGLGFGAVRAGHHLLLAHGLAVRALRETVHPADESPVRIGIAQQHFPVIAASDAPDDQTAAAVFATLTNWAWSDPIMLGSYPDSDTAALTGVDPAQLAEDLKVISEPLDFYGVNYYEPAVIEAPKPGKDYTGVMEVDIPGGFPFAVVPYEAAERTDFGWPVAPEGLTEILLQIHERYPNMPPILITESGASFHDDVDPSDGAIHDPKRIAYIEGQLRAVLEAMEAGVSISGYYVWSAFDNLEWAAGFRERFGLVYVDRETLERIPKDSARWYRGTIEAQPGR